MNAFAFFIGVMVPGYECVVVIILVKYLEFMYLCFILNVCFNCGTCGCEAVKRYGYTWS